MIAVARSISHGQAYSEYAQRKDRAVFVGAENMITNTDLIFDNKAAIEELWQEFEEAKCDYVRKGKDVTRDTIVIEFSPTTNESEGWTREQWFDKAKELLEEMDKRELQHAKWDRKKNDWERDADGKKKMYALPQTSLSKSKWMAMLHKDSASGIWHLHIIISRFISDNKLNNDTDIAKRAAQAAEELNMKYGYPKAMDIHAEHVEEINKLLNDILFDLEGEDMNFEEFEQRVKNATFVDYKGNVRNYDIQYHKDKNGNINGYSIKRGNSTFTDKELGFRMTKIENVQKNIIKDAVYDTLRRMDDAFFSWEKFTSIMQTHHDCIVAPKTDSNGDVYNYTITRGKNTYNASQIGAHITAKKIEAEWRKEQKKLVEREQQTATINRTTEESRPGRWSKEGKELREREVAGQQHSATHSTEPTASEKERQDAITVARESIARWTHSSFGAIDNTMKEIIGNGAAAKSIENGESPFINVNLVSAAQELSEGLELSASQLAAIATTAAGALVDMVIPPNVPVSGGGGGGNNDLPKQKDDWWDKWKPAFAKKPTKKSKLGL